MPNHLLRSLPPAQPLITGTGGWMDGSACWALVPQNRPGTDHPHTPHHTYLPTPPRTHPHYAKTVPRFRLEPLPPELDMTVHLPSPPTDFPTEPHARQQPRAWVVWNSD